MITNGSYFTTTLNALNLEDDEQKQDTTTNATNIVAAVVRAYGGTAEQGIDPATTPATPLMGLVYGRIQSGKTRAMIASTAMGFDNKFRIAIVMTSNINDLVSQTHLDFTSGLPGVMTFTKDSDLKGEVDNVKVQLEMGTTCLLIVCSKGTTSLDNVTKFLKAVGAENYPTMIFDDEGDQASLDTNTARRARSAVAVGPTEINRIIQNELRPALPRHVYVSVTGTPQSILLQSAESSHRPAFIEMLPPGRSYTGGDYFFDTDEPEANPHKLISIADHDEITHLLDENHPIPEGLKRSILFFLMAGAAAIKKIGTRPRGYSYLCHPSLNNSKQRIAADRINAFLLEITRVLLGSDGPDILTGLRNAYEDLKVTLGSDTPSFEELIEVIKPQLATRRLLIINGKEKRKGIDYGTGLNFLIGGNTLGRGIAIRDLLVTYYVRDARVSQIDTMHQHARMYGYRKKTLAYTRVFIPRHLYYKFRDIHRSDTDSRAFIAKHKDMPATFPIQYSFGLRPTRRGVLHPNKTDSLRPEMHVYPNYIALPQSDVAYEKVLGLLREHLGFITESEVQMETVGKRGVVISAAEAAALVKPIKTSSKNTWRDRTIGAAIGKVAEVYDGRVNLKFRCADRTVREEGFISTGTLSGDELDAARGDSIPTLWVMSTRTKSGSPVGEGLKFMYPTLVIPANFPHLFMFNRG